MIHGILISFHHHSCMHALFWSSFTELKAIHFNTFRWEIIFLNTEMEGLIFFFTAIGRKQVNSLGTFTFCNFQSDTSMTEVSLSKSTPPINGISQNEAGWDNYGYDHPPEFFTRSFSDGIPSWKNINNLRALHTHYQTTDDIYATHNITHPIDVQTQQSIEAIYSKPLKRRDRENHVHFNDDMGLNGRKTGANDSPILHLNGPYNNMFQKNWSKGFLAEIQEKANNIKLRNSLAIESGRLEV